MYNPCTFVLATRRAAIRNHTSRPFVSGTWCYAIVWCPSEISKKLHRQVANPGISEGCIDISFVRGDLHRLWILIIDVGPRVYMECRHPKPRESIGQAVFVSPNDDPVNDSKECCIRRLCEVSKLLRSQYPTSNKGRSQLRGYGSIYLVPFQAFDPRHWYIDN